MSDIKKTALVILIIALLSNTFTQYAYAANDYNHAELFEYEGYGQAMYETIVEQSTYMTGQYTDNKEYVSSSIDEIINYANFWKNEFNDWNSVCSSLSVSSINDCLRDGIEKGAGLTLTVGDWLKKLFSDYEETLGPEDTALDFSHYGQYFDYVKTDATQYLIVKSGLRLQMTVVYNGKTYTPDTVSLDPVVLVNNNLSVGFMSGVSTVRNLGSRANAIAKRDEIKAINSLNGMLNGLHEFGVAVGVKDIDLQIPSFQPRPISRINNYYRENSIPTIPVPKLKPQLVCPDGTRISMNINGSTFLAVDGTVMMVGKDGTAEVNGQLCNLNWQKPTVEYNPDGQPVVTDPDGNQTNLDTGDTTSKPPGATDLEGCTGVLCGIGKLLDGVGSVVTAIGDLVKKLLDGLLGLFVPDDLDFVTEEFNKITKKLNDKIAITDSLKEAITSVFDGGGSNPLANISINLPITNEPLTFGNVSFIEEGVPILRRVISAIVVLYTIAYVYRKITGRGGVMER